MAAHMNAPKTAFIRRYSLLLPAFAVLLWHSLQFNFVTDDAYISFVFSRNFAEHGQLVFNVGQHPVEGYTNFLWTFLLGILAFLGLAPEIMSLVLGYLFAAGTMVVAMRMVERVLGGRSGWDYLPAALLSLSSGYACWTSGGLETQMFAFFVTLSLYTYLRADLEHRLYRYLGIFLALAAMTRPEGLLITGLLGLHRLLTNLVRDRKMVSSRSQYACLAVFLLLWAPWFAWRWWYYGYFFPNTYYVKAAGETIAHYSEQMHSNGRYYLWQWLTQSKVLYAAPIAVAGFSLANPRSERFFMGSAALLIGAAYLLYTMQVGGDFMGLHRFVMPVFVLAAIGLSVGLAIGCRWLKVRLDMRGSTRVGRVAPMVVILLLALFARSQYQLTSTSIRWGNWRSDHGIDTPSYLALYAHDRKVIGQHMRQCFSASDFAIFGGVGAKPYYARAKGVDVFGLVSDVVAHKVPRTRARAGHNKWAPDSLLYKTYKPDFVFHCYSLHSDPNRPHLNCSGNFWKSKGYQRVTMHIPGLQEKGEYYTFFVAPRRVQSFRETCPGVVP